jgi:lactate permease
VLAFAHTRALLLSFDVLLIVWSAFLLYRVADEAGAIRIIGEALPYLTNDRGMQVILIGWVFASFLQGVGGFGVPVAVTAPLLVGLGFNPIAAVVIPSIGHGWREGEIMRSMIGYTAILLLSISCLSAIAIWIWK